MYQLDRLHELRDEIYRIANRNKVSKVYVFGSCARKEETPQSDVDFLAVFNEGASLLDQSQMRLDLIDLLGREVDVISYKALKNPKFGPGVRKDMVEL